MCVGIDFGTTNSVLVVVDEAGRLSVARHGPDRGSANFRSILCFVKEETAGRARISVKAGPAAIAAYLEHGSDSRLIQSVKSLVANPNFSNTFIFGRKFTIEDLVAEIVRAVRASAEEEAGETGVGRSLGGSVTAGRPVKFAGQFANENLALERLARAFDLAGFSQVDFVPEPLAAAYKFAKRLKSAQTCLVADFGGGTSDFSLVRFRPGGGCAVAMETLGNSGVGLAGDRLDYRIIENVVCPKLGLGTNYVSLQKRLPIPAHYYARFQRWSDLSFLRAPEVLRELRSLMRMAEEPEAIHRLLYVIEEELGFELYQAVSAVKSTLSACEDAVLEWRRGPIQINEVITRAQFERWIAPDLDRIDASVEKLFEGAEVSPDQVDHVFMTGGTSFVPAVRLLMQNRFPQAKFSAEEEFISVGAGLALCGQENSAASYQAG
jgi:hypothetical chaperone protein